MREAFVKRRDQLPGLLNSRGLTGVGVEVGVQRGAYSETILAGSRLAELILVDPWREFADYQDIANVAQAAHDRILVEARTRLGRFGRRANFLRTTSLEAAEQTADGSLDFVYLDGRHDYESVIADLYAWCPKMRPGGIIAGHDYVDGNLPSGLFGVRSAVDEFFGERRLQVHDTYQDRPWSSWFVVLSSRPSHVTGAVRSVLWFGYRIRRKAERFFAVLTHAP